MRKLWMQIKGFKPPLVPCCVAAAAFSGASLLCVATSWGGAVSPVLLYCIYVCAALFLALAVWAVVLFCRRVSPRRRLLALAHQNVLAARMVQDVSFRTVTFTYASFSLNLIFTLAKGVAGWISGSWWLLSLAAYYLVLCVSKLLLLRGSRKQSKPEPPLLHAQREWKAYRICGMLFFVMTLVLLGVVILIVSEGNRFTYDGTLIFAVALYDFYCLISAIVSMLRTRKQHTPVIVAIKTIGLATALVSMLSLQTAMFVSFGAASDAAFKSLMNFISGASVCALLFFIGLTMMLQATKKIKTLKNTEVSL